MNRFIRLSAAVALPALLAACTLAPRYHQPASPVAPAYENAATQDGATPAADISWH
jgi:hypothetical protein